MARASAPCETVGFAVVAGGVAGEMDDVVEAVGVLVDVVVAAAVAAVVVGGAVVAAAVEELAVVVVAEEYS